MINLGAFTMPPRPQTAVNGRLSLTSPTPLVQRAVLIFMKENENYGVLTPNMQAHVSMMAIVGALTGQIVFGILGDQVRCVCFGFEWTTAGLLVCLA